MTSSYWNGDAWRWSTDHHRTPAAVTIAVIEPTEDDAESKRRRDDARLSGRARAMKGKRAKRVAFGFARALEAEEQEPTATPELEASPQDEALADTLGVPAARLAAALTAFGAAAGMSVDEARARMRVALSATSRPHI